jgi:putative two-component system hydrogenase maturation factor HypX/HoxX
MLALAADQVYARRGVVLNPHYRTMGGLFGSEYWTYSLARRIGAVRALEITATCQPMGVDEACDLGLLDDAFGVDVHTFECQLDDHIENLVSDGRRLAGLLDAKRRRRREDERAKPLAAYRAAELAHMADNFFGPDPSYHLARRRFVRKEAPATAANLAEQLGGHISRGR